jgi:hypothetical protein
MNKVKQWIKPKPLRIRLRRPTINNTRQFLYGQNNLKLTVQLPRNIYVYFDALNIVKFVYILTKIISSYFLG